MKNAVRLLSIAIAGLLLINCHFSSPRKSVENLRTAFNNESTSSSKYSKYAQVALAEGLDTIAGLFDAVAKSENIHAANHAKVLDLLDGNAGLAVIGSYEAKTTIENLQEAANSEAYELQKMYPGYVKTAEEEKAPDAGKSFTWAQDGDKVHSRYFRMVLGSLTNGNSIGLSIEWLVCPKCGNIYCLENLPPVCDFCLTKKESFIGYTEDKK